MVGRSRLLLPSHYQYSEILALFLSTPPTSAAPGSVGSQPAGPSSRAEWDQEFYRLFQRLSSDEGLPWDRAHRQALQLMEASYGPRPAAAPNPNKPQGPQASWILRLAAKIAGAFVGGKMKAKLNRWLPIIGGVILAAEALLKALGQTEIASVLHAFSSTLGITAPDWAVSLIGQAVPAALVIFGAVRKVLSERAKVR